MLLTGVINKVLLTLTTLLSSTNKVQEINIDTSISSYLRLIVESTATDA